MKLSITADLGEMGRTALNGERSVDASSACSDGRQFARTRRPRSTSFVACVLASIVFLPFLSHAATNEAPDFKEVYELLRANLAGTDEAGLNRAAVQGLLTQLAPG